MESHSPRRYQPTLPSARRKGPSSKNVRSVQSLFPQRPSSKSSSPQRTRRSSSNSCVRNEADPNSPASRGLRNGEGQVPVQVVVRCRPCNPLTVVGGDHSPSSANGASVAAIATAAFTAGSAGPQQPLTLPLFQLPPQLQIAAVEDSAGQVSLHIDPGCIDQAATPKSARGRAPDARTFCCNHFLEHTATQEEVFMHAAPIIDRVMEGYNGTIFCYGITGSGKTYTMSGPSASNDITRHGIVQRSARRIFEYIRDRSSQGEMFAVEASFLEVYSGDGVRETLLDLLEEEGKPQQPSPSFMDAPARLDVKQDPLNPHAFVVDGLRAVPISSPDDMLRVLDMGQRRCAFMETSRNCHSSRSHCLFMVTVECLAEQQLDGRSPRARRGKLVLVDLAGSESLKKVSAANTADEELRKRQAIGINRVLSHLGTVVNNLNSGFSRAAGVRNSAVTMLLRDCLGGSARALLVANIGPEACWWSETYLTLKFAQQMMFVKNSERVTYVSEGGSTLLQMRKRHYECLERLGGVDTQEDAELQKLRLQQEIDELSQRLLTRATASEKLEQVQAEHTKNMEELRSDLKETMARDIANLQERNQREMEQLREEMEMKACEGAAIAEQNLEAAEFAHEAHVSTMRAECDQAMVATHTAEDQALAIRQRLQLIEQHVDCLVDEQRSFADERLELQEESTQLRQQSKSSLDRLLEFEGMLQRYRTESFIEDHEMSRQRELWGTESAAAFAEREVWKLRETELSTKLRSLCGSRSESLQNVPSSPGHAGGLIFSPRQNQLQQQQHQLQQLQQHQYESELHSELRDRMVKLEPWIGK